MTLTPNRALVSTLLSLALTAGAGQAMAQDGQAQSGQPWQTGTSSDFDGTQLDRFAKAREAVQEINETLTEQLGSVDNTAAAQSMQREAQQEMVGAVEQAGLSVQEYNDIAFAMQQDRSLAERVQQRLEDE